LSKKNPPVKLRFSDLDITYYEKIMESYLGRPEEILGEHANDFSINHEDVSDNIEKLGKSFENFKKTQSFKTIYEQIKQFEEINRRIDR
jgi:predicted DNA-binding protein YlxM (UPF0122 family)